MCLHSFVYHFGSEAVECTWQGLGPAQTAVLRPGDSLYIGPLVRHRFSVISTPPASRVPPKVARPNPNGVVCAVGRRLFVVRIPGHLTGETLAEFGTFSPFGRERVGAETLQWYS